MSEVTIPGRSINSTINSMKSLGSIGTQVLNDHDIDIVDLEKNYPVKIRSAIHEEILTRFGPVSIEICGFQAADDFPDFLKSIQKKYLDDVKKMNKLEALDSFVDWWVSFGTEMLKSGTIGGEGDYGLKAIKEDDTYIFQYITAVPLKHYQYWFGSHLRMYFEVFNDFLNYDLEFVGEKSIQSKGWSKIVFKSIFSELNDSTKQKTVSEKKLEMYEQLFTSVVNYSNAQKLNADEAKKKAEEEKHNAELKQVQIEKISNIIGKYVPPQIHKAIEKGDYSEEIITKRKKLTIFFSDIKSFTGTSEHLQPEDLTKYLNEYFSEMTTIAIKHGGTIDKYIGDALMIFFGDPESLGPKKDAINCVKMAIEMQNKLVELRSKWSNDGFIDPFRVRMGINTGFCNVGNFGSAQRLTYTVIGAEVNLTQRLESNSDIDGILISHETYSNTKEVINVVEKETITMKGITRKIQTYNVLGLKDNLKESLIDKKIASISNLDNSNFSQKEKNLLIEFIKSKLI